jgi:hypothetical protein
VSDSRVGVASVTGTYLKDASKPDGDACREDGTLKDASEMEWPNSPSQTNFENPADLDSNADRADSELSYLSFTKEKKKKARHLRRRRLGHSDD